MWNERVGRGPVLRALVVAAALLGMCSGALAGPVFVPTCESLILKGDEVLVLGSLSNWCDVDKLNLGGNLYFDDVNSNGEHDPGEAYAAANPGGWTAGSDLSCWLASGSSMLGQAGANGGDARGIYDYYALNGIVVGSTTYTWDNGGLQEYVIDQWIADHPDEAGTLSLTTDSYDAYWSPEGLFKWNGYNVRQGAMDAVTGGDQVGIGIWPLDLAGDHGGGHALTVQDVSNTIPSRFTVTDSDRDHDFEGPGDLNTYDDAWFTGQGDYSWYSDFYADDDGEGMFYYPLADVGYIAILSGTATAIAEPAALIFFGTGVVGVLGFVARRRMRKS